MKRKGLAVLLVLIGLGLGATLLRDQVPLGKAGPVGQASPARPGAEAAAKLQNEQNTIDIVQKFEPGLVFINTEQQVATQDPFAWMYGGEAQTEVQRGVGSGFFVNEGGDILTNFHVVAGEGGGSADRITIRVMGSPRSVPAKVIGVAPEYDLALIRPEGLEARYIKPIPLGDSDTLKAGQKTIAMGAPFGLDFSVSEGIVSSVSRQIPIGFNRAGEGITQKAIQTDAAINPGNSGGPLLDSAGRVIGINTQIFSATASAGAGQSAGVGFAIPVNVAKNLLPRLQAARGGLVTAPQLGVVAGLVAVTRRSGEIPVGTSMLSADSRRAWNLPENGIVVGEVTRGLPAAKAGIRGGNRVEAFRGGAIRLGGDVIVAVEGKPVDAIEDLQAALIDKQVGEAVTLRVFNAGQLRDVEVVLDESAFR